MSFYAHLPQQLGCDDILITGLILRKWHPLFNSSSNSSIMGMGNLFLTCANSHLSSSQVGLEKRMGFEIYEPPQRWASPHLGLYLSLFHLRKSIRAHIDGSRSFVKQHMMIVTLAGGNCDGSTNTSVNSSRIDTMTWRSTGEGSSACKEKRYPMTLLELREEYLCTAALLMSLSSGEESNPLKRACWPSLTSFGGGWSPWSRDWWLLAIEHPPLGHDHLRAIVWPEQ